ncbi:MAG TPA: hypothetical protein PLK77_12385 [Pyrinomonadaceae bacterium]|nr:hypothetical protein [Pyrinomonadaceae bacterium]
MQYRVVRMKWITRSFVREHRDHIFLFGDNLARRGFGGQAAQMRAEPNAIGIPTKKLPSNVDQAFFTDAEFEQNKTAIDRAFDRLYRMSSTVGQVIVMPAHGLGTGRAQLENRAPLTFAYLQKCLRNLSSQKT